MRKIRMILLCVLLIFSLSGCGQKGQEATQTKTSDEKIAETSEIRETLAETENSETDEDTEMKLYFSDIEIPISWENCKAVRELEEEVANGRYHSQHVHVRRLGAGWFSGTILFTNLTIK